MNKREFYFSKNAINYSWQQLIQRAGGIADFEVKDNKPSVCGIPLFYAHPTEISSPGKKIVVIPCKSTDWGDLLEKDVETLAWASKEKLFPSTPNFLYDEAIPILFWSEISKKEKLVSLFNDGTLIFNLDILATTFFMLSRWEEIVCPENVDEHGRFPAFKSVAYKQNFLDVPIVDVLGLALRAWISILVPDWRPVISNFTANITHDIDWVSHFTSIAHFFRVTGGEVIKKKNVKNVALQIKRLLLQKSNPAQNDFFKSIFTLASISERNGIRGKFYFMSAKPSKYQQGYEPSLPLIQNCMLSLQKHGHEIGIHPGYETFDNLPQLIAEKEKLEKILGSKIFDSRQHFLRFHATSTWQNLETTGLVYDSTMGYADFEGFRCGTCHTYHPFDIHADRIMDIKEIPLIVMDTTLKLYRKLTPEQGKLRIVELANKCLKVEGVFTLLWHNTSLSEDWEEWGKMYNDIVYDLTQMKHNV